ncbi:MAG TPA: lytic transglycosylase domain-containing protein [Puia sp.]|nr:lytic transglycosylase domain-containing protein [Puia sp.]
MLTAVPSKFAYKSLLLLSLALFAIRPAGSVPTAENAASADKSRFPLNVNARVFVNNYIKENKELLEAVQRRSRSPFKLMDAIFTRYGLPKEVKYLAVIESELKPTALSPVGARGPWQLMPETAQLLGLTINTEQDDRTQYYKSTVAAAKYLKDLYAEFGDWLLVVAAYNGGSAQVYHAIHKAGSRNFWNLQYFLPAESRLHVKKFIATHYYFEGQGSVTTLTRAECIACAANSPTTGTLTANSALSFAWMAVPRTAYMPKDGAYGFSTAMELKDL